jgi:hypothetical protein
VLESLRPKYGQGLNLNQVKEALMVRDSDADNDDTPAPKGDVQEKLKLVAHYAMLGFAPVVSIAALCIALFATGNHADRTQSSDLNSRLDDLNASFMASRTELDNLKFATSREKSLRGDEHKKRDELDEKIIQNVTRLQTKLKISPTLEEQLRIVANSQKVAPPVVAAIPSHVAASAPVVTEKILSASAPVSASAVSNPASVTKSKEVAKQPAATSAAKVPEKKAAPVPAPKAEEKMSPQVKALRNAIDQYNKE